MSSIKAYRAIFLSLVLFLAFSGEAFASLPVSFEGGSSAKVTVSTGTYNVHGNFQSITTDGTKITVTLTDDSSSYIIITSSAKHTFSVSENALRSNFTCGDSSSTLQLDRPTESPLTVSITPSATTCSSSSGPNVGVETGSGSGGGGGGYSQPAQSPTPMPSPTASPVALAQLPAAQQKIAVLVSPMFTQTLVRGARGADVQRLQKLLNTRSEFQVAASGVGSPGSETEYFGSLTEQAVIKFQLANNVIVSEASIGAGVVGPRTREAFAQVFGVAVSTATPPSGELSQPPAVPGPSTVKFNKPLYIGMSDSLVLELQRVLNADSDTRVAESGIGSQGNETLYFGLLTEIAVKKLQVKYGLARPGDPGYGYVGPKTRAQLNQLTVESASTLAPQSSEAESSDGTAPDTKVKIQELQEMINSLLKQVEALRINQ